MLSISPELWFSEKRIVILNVILNVILTVILFVILTVILNAEINGTWLEVIQ